MANLVQEHDATSDFAFWRQQETAQGLFLVAGRGAGESSGQRAWCGHGRDGDLPGTS